jgi:hypothetical protein
LTEKQLGSPDTFNAMVKSFAGSWKNAWDREWFVMQRQRYDLSLFGRTVRNVAEEGTTFSRYETWGSKFDIDFKLLGDQPAPWLKDHLQLTPHWSLTMKAVEYTAQFFPFGVPCLVTASAGVSAKVDATLKLPIHNPQGRLPSSVSVGLTVGCDVRVIGGVGFNWGWTGGVVGIEAVVTPLAVGIRFEVEHRGSENKLRVVIPFALSASGEVNFIMTGWLRAWGWSKEITERINLWRPPPHNYFRRDLISTTM